MTDATKQDPGAALNRVLAFLGKTQQPDTGTSVPAPTFPSARVRPAIEEIAQCATLEELNAKQVNLKALAKDLFDWKNDGQIRATGNVVKALGRALTATGEDGTSKFPQAVEMIGFAAAAAPLLQPDRLARLIDTAPTVACAYAPDRYTIRLAGAMHTILKDYPEARRETLLVDLWRVLHEGRFWDVTASIVDLGNNRNQQERRAHQTVVDQIVDGHPVGSLEATSRLVDAFIDDKLPLGELTLELVAAFPQTQKLRDHLAEAAEAALRGDIIEPDKVVMIAHIPWASAAERPKSPAAWVLRALVQCLEPDPDTGEALLEGLPKKPKRWSDLYPEVPIVGFPHPPAARALDGRPLPGTDDVTVEVVKTSGELEENARYMGNCTRMFRGEMEQGTYILFRLWHGEDLYNAAMRFRNDWRVTEINSRFNAGGVPPHIRTAFSELAAQMPPPPDEICEPALDQPTSVPVHRLTDATRPGSSITLEPGRSPFSPRPEQLTRALVPAGEHETGPAT